jgi:isoprenylcysteine carboxyl methyltransferase (ICMT) family protein YpbQ
MVTLPLIHGAWLTAGVFSLVNGTFLTPRVRVEEEALGNRGHALPALAENDEVV